jgi:hypothetical protein
MCTRWGLLIACGWRVRGEAMDARDEAALGSAGRWRHNFGGLDFDAMDWGVGAGGRCVVIAGAVGGVVVGVRLLLESEQRGFGFARGFERFAHYGIHVIAASDKWHGASRRADVTRDL